MQNKNYIPSRLVKSYGLFNINIISGGFIWWEASVGVFSLERGRRSVSFPSAWATTTSAHAEGACLRLLSLSYQTWGGVGRKSQLWNPPSEILPSPSVGPSELFCVLWDELKWCVLIAFNICPSKHFPDHHREGSTNYSYKKTNFVEMWLSQEFVKFLVHQTVYLNFVHLVICKLYLTKDDPPKIEYSFIHQKTKKLIDR